MIKSISCIFSIDSMNIKTFDLNLLRALLALLETQSVSTAARRLNLTQPATSAALARLRHALADVLLIRQGNRMSLTARAERLLPHVRLVMAQIEDALSDYVFDPLTSDRTFRIAATDDAIEIIVAPLIDRLRTAAPASLIDIVSVSEDVARDLSSGAVDVAIAADWWLRHVRHRQTILTDRYVGMSGTRSRFDLASYTRAEHVIVAPHGRKPGVVDGVLRKMGLTRRVAVTVPDFASAARLVASGRLIVAMPARIAAHYTEHYSLKLFELPIELPKLHIAIAMHARSTSDSAVGWLIDQIKAELRPGSRKPTS